MSCDIVVPIWNQLERTKACLESVIKNTHFPYRLILVDNASDHATQAYLASFQQTHGAVTELLRNEDNLGFIKAANQGARAANAGYLCILNNDTRVYAGWLAEMVAAAESSSDIGIVNPSSNTLARRPGSGESLDEFVKELSADKGHITEVGSALGFCMVIKRAVLEKVGLFDEVYGMGNFEDTDLSRKALQAGFRCVIADAAYVWHEEGGSFTRGKRYDRDFEKNRKIFETRWGKPQRILRVLRRYDETLIDLLKIESLRLAGSGNWVYIFVKGSIDTSGLPRHANVVIKKFPDFLFPLWVLVKILTKKKRFNRVAWYG